MVDRTQIVIWLSWLLIAVMNVVMIWEYFNGRGN
jgi:hypothetical protein